MNSPGCAFATVLVALVAFSADPCKGQTVLVSAAASLTESFTAIGREYQRSHKGVTVRFNFGASGTLQRQIAAGAPVDVFASAAEREMDALQAAHLVIEPTRRDFAANRLALVAARSSTIRRFEDLALPSVKRVAISDPSFVPSGLYAKQTLENRRLWPSVTKKAILGQTVRQTLVWVEQQDADCGIVFATDALIAPSLRVVAFAHPGKDHQPILYPVAAVTTGPQPALAADFVRFLGSGAARAILTHHGFSIPHSANRRGATAGR